MLTRLCLVNFQKHRRLDVELSPAVTTIAGPSDTGKSAVLRALRWLALNKPQGSSFVKKGTKAATVVVEVEGAQVRRKRGPGANLYRLGEEEFRSFGTGVPNAVEELLNLNEMNFQRQHDPPFWFSLSPSQISRELNRIVDLESIDRLQAELRARETRGKAEVEVSRDRLLVARKQVAGLEWVEDCHTSWLAIEGIAKEAHQEEMSCALLAGLIETLADQQSVVDGLSGAIKRMVQSFDSITQVRGEGQELLFEIGVLGSLVHALEDVEAELCESESQEVAAANRLAKLVTDRCPLCGQKISQSQSSQLIST